MKPLIVALLALVALLAAPHPARADASDLPGDGFPASRYESLWTKSPFAVATAEAAQDSPDYSLAGVAQLDGISYVSVIDKQNQNQRYLISSDKPSNGISLVSLTRGHDSSDTVAVIQKNGQPISLKLEAVPAAALGPGVTPPGIVPMPGAVTPQIPMPGAPGSQRPPVRFHRFPIHLPPPPAATP